MRSVFVISKRFWVISKWKLSWWFDVNVRKNWLANSVYLFSTLTTGNTISLRPYIFISSEKCLAGCESRPKRKIFWTGKSSQAWISSKRSSDRRTCWARWKGKQGCHKSSTAPANDTIGSNRQAWCHLLRHKSFFIKLRSHHMKNENHTHTHTHLLEIGRELLSTITSGSFQAKFSQLVLIWKPKSHVYVTVMSSASQFQQVQKSKN